MGDQRPYGAADPYCAQPARIGNRFLRALVAPTRFSSTAPPAQQYEATGAAQRRCALRSGQRLLRTMARRDHELFVGALRRRRVAAARFGAGREVRTYPASARAEGWRAPAGDRMRLGW